jgi:hypothetical protein
MLKRPSKNISLYLNYPTQERLKTLRERVAAWNFTDKMKEKRLSKIANEKEIVAYLMGDAETIAIVDSRQKEIDRRKNKSTETKNELYTPKFYGELLKDGTEIIKMDIESPILKKAGEIIHEKEMRDMCRKSVDMAIGEPKKREFYMPEFVSNVLDGGAYPEQYECDAREQKILYNQKFIELFQQYRTAKSQTTADIVLSQIVSLVKELDQ